MMDERTEESLTLTLEQARSDLDGTLIDEYLRSLGLPNYFYSTSNAFSSDEGEGKRAGWVNLKDFRRFLAEKASGTRAEAPGHGARRDSARPSNSKKAVIQSREPARSSKIASSRTYKNPRFPSSDSSPDDESTPPPAKRPKTGQPPGRRDAVHSNSGDIRRVRQLTEKAQLNRPGVSAAAKSSNQGAFRADGVLFRPGRKVPSGQECSNCRKLGLIGQELQRVDGGRVSTRTCAVCRRRHMSCSRTPRR
ncbi:hypothetical protein DL96DRAFT_1613547 [Flagelloscypha sp. PMI_526]|nr:hypothetical protein DL96DRAFT_1613547 [Flagelloscypha sp. PMI_526]